MFGYKVPEEIPYTTKHIMKSCPPTSHSPRFAPDSAGDVAKRHGQGSFGDSGAASHSRFMGSGLVQHCFIWGVGLQGLGGDVSSGFVDVGGFGQTPAFWANGRISAGFRLRLVFSGCSASQVGFRV